MKVVRDAAYWREYRRRWRASHRDTENARKRRLRAQPGWRAAHEPRHASRAMKLEPIPEPYTGHSIFERAKAIVGRSRSTLAALKDPLHEDLLGTAVVALLEGSDPAEAVRAARARETAFRRITMPIADWL